jgi:outer membrane protein assembly factor BamB
MPIVADGTVYHLDSREARQGVPGGTWLGAFDAATGETQWETQLWEVTQLYFFYHQGPPVLGGEELFAQTHDGVKAVSTDGEILWTFENVGNEQPTPDSAPPVVTDDFVVAGSYDTDDRPERVFGIDRETGEEVWTREFGKGSVWRLTRDGDTVYVPIFGGDGGLFALDIETGETRNSYDIDPEGPVSVANETMFVHTKSDTDAKLRAFDTGSETERWNEEVETVYSESKVVIDEERLYHNDWETLMARRPETGEELWRFGDGDAVEIHHSTPVFAADLLYLVGYQFLGEGEGYGQCVFVLDPETGEEVGRITPWGNETGPAISIPAIAEGAMYLSHSYDGLICLEDCTAGILGNCLLG